MDLYNASKTDDQELSIDCYKKAEEIFNRPNSAGSDRKNSFLILNYLQLIKFFHL